jgi:hypothetical protein
MSRRRAIAGALSFAGLTLLAPPSFALAPGPARRSFAFDVRRAGSSIGRHLVELRHEAGGLVVEVEIDISVSFAFIPVFSYRHRNREIWQDDRLLALDSETQDDGESHRVSARRNGGVLQVSGTEGNITVPSDILPTSYWHPRTVLQKRLLDTQHGRILEVDTRFVREEVLSDGAAARRYRVTGDLDLELWYSPSGEWQNIAFQARGSVISYARLERESGAST